MPQGSNLALVTGQHLTAQGLRDKIKHVQAENNDVGVSRLASLLDDLVNFPLTAGLYLISEARKLIVGETPVKEQSNEQKNESKRLSETKAMFACLKLVYDSKPAEMLKATTEQTGFKGWHAVYGFSTATLKAKGFTPTGGAYIAPDVRTAIKDAKQEGLAVANARLKLGKEASQDEVMAAAVKSRELAKITEALGFNPKNAGECLKFLGTTLRAAIEAANGISADETFRSVLSQGLENADYWRMQVEEWTRIVAHADEFAKEQKKQQEAAAEAVA